MQKVSRSLSLVPGSYHRTIRDQHLLYPRAYIVVPPPAKSAPPPAPTHLLTQDYGRVLLPQQVRNYVDSFLGQNRITQNSYTSYMCLMASLNKEAKAQVILRRDKFIVDNKGVGPLLLKVIILLAHGDTEATVMVLR